jgi:protein-tyrosine-phosphatase
VGMKIHFVSYGHVFRSRLAEAYLKFILRRHKDIQITSSGIKYEKEVNGPIAWYAMKILVDHQLTPFMSDIPVITTKELLDNQDLVIFLDEASHDFSKRRLGYKGRKHDIWHVEYLPPEKTGSEASLDKDLFIIKRSEHIFKNIEDHCRRFSEDLSYSDIPPYMESL